MMIRDDSVIRLITCFYLSRLLLQRGSVPQALFLLISCSFPHSFYLKENKWLWESLPSLPSFFFFPGIIQLPPKMKPCCWALPVHACPSLARPTGPHLPSHFLDPIHINSFPSEPHSWKSNHFGHIPRALLPQPQGFQYKHPVPHHCAHFPSVCDQPEEAPELPQGSLAGHIDKFYLCNHVMSHPQNCPGWTNR